MILTRLYTYKDLLLVFIWREFTVRYKQSSIGFLWAIFQPLSMMLMFTFIFSYVMPVKLSDQPYVIFFYAGILPWSFFESSLKYSIPSLTNHYELITKIYFPREILPLSGICVAFLDFCIATLVFIVLLCYYRIHITLNLFWFVPLLLLLILFTIAVAMFFASLNVYYRDVKLAMAFFIQLWFFATPVFYSIDKIPERIKYLLFLNPMTFIVENMRRILIEGRGVVTWQFLFVLSVVTALLVASYFSFIRMERRFADVI
jgi:ABC-type polysaccharide/polyol phosphate export permease